MSGVAVARWAPATGRARSPNWPVFACIQQIAGQENVRPEDTGIGSLIYAVKPGDGSAREQAASCQQ